MNPEKKEAIAQILLVDDNPNNLRLLTQILINRGYVVRAVTSGARAIASIEKSPPDLVLLDIRMPGMDGFEVAQQLKSQPLTQAIPVLFISALDDVHDKVRAFESGGVDYITKPFQLEEVLARVDTHLALRRLQRDLEKANQRMEYELDMASRLQASFMHKDPPMIPGWDLAVSLLPARETSGDFYDTISLPGGLWGIIIADVVDKGVAAAMYMAMTGALLRANIIEHPDNPGEVLKLVNQHLVDQTGGSRFVTIFLGILDPSTGKMLYGNAGHNPPLLFHAGGADPVLLGKTGMALGLFPDLTWQTDQVQVDPGNVLVLYTDGITEAQNLAGDFFGLDALEQSVRMEATNSARSIRNRILQDFRHLMKDAILEDDIALMVLAASA